MARRKRHMGESATEDNDEESVSSPSILGSMLSLDEELNGGRKSTKSPRKSHIPIYDPESSPTKSPRPPKRKAYPPKEEPNEPSVLHQDSVFVSTPDEIPTKPAPVRLDFPNHVTGSPPRHLTSVAKGSSRKAPHTGTAGGYSSIHKPAETNSSTIKTHNVDTTPLPSDIPGANMEPVDQDPTESVHDNIRTVEPSDGTDFDDQIALVMQELEALNLLHSQLMETKAKAREHFQRSHQSNVSNPAVLHAPLATTTNGGSKSPRRLGTLHDTPSETKPSKSPKKGGRHLKPDTAAMTTAALPPLPAYPMAAVQDAYPWSKFMLQQMMQSSHHVHGAATPVVYVPILNPAYMAEVKHQSGYDNKQHVQPLVPSPPSSVASKAPDEVASVESTTKAPDKKPRPVKKASPKRPHLAKKHTSRELVFPR